ncbi:DUF2188 domain-containing protein [Halopseudomonas nanhaiensis]|uniref:DUF2188 domain-containing protein n=1 Tax=Halopseudomonas nanhaiensis TaxID=2830842 RepID=UPI001CBD0355|nr:DUF2188 domain-containing protein [Halopseudomonas nanhaiensis]UAW98682.1 DUF2188 domain-containing protein [Halopseudomonas nanhaiensis]
MQNYHVTPTDNGWQLIKEGASRPARRAQTKKEMLTLMKEFMEGKTGSVKIHLQDGSIQEERTYPRSADPARSEG